MSIATFHNVITTISNPIGELKRQIILVAPQDPHMALTQNMLHHLCFMTYMLDNIPYLLDNDKEEMIHLCKASRKLFKDLIYQDPRMRAAYIATSPILRSIAALPGTRNEGALSIHKILDSTDKVLN